MATYTFNESKRLIDADSAEVAKGTTLVSGDVLSFPFKGYVEGFAFSYIPVTKCKIECYGAANGVNVPGGYAWGETDFSSQPTVKSLFVVAGEQGASSAYSGSNQWGGVTFGGGGSADGDGQAGGASDVRTYYDHTITTSVCEARKNGSRGDVDKGTLHWQSLASRIIVAGGAGGRDNHGGSQGRGLCGGGFTGTYSTGYVYAEIVDYDEDTGESTPTGVYAWQESSSRASGDGGCGQQTYSGGAGSRESGEYILGRFGVGGSAWSFSGGGGGGFYGGSTGNGGGGGSSYVSGNASCPYATSSGITFTTSGTKSGVNTSAGYVLITLLADAVVGDWEEPEEGTYGTPTKPGGPIDNNLTPYSKALYYQKTGETTSTKVTIYTDSGVSDITQFSPYLRVSVPNETANLFIPLTSDSTAGYSDFRVGKDGATLYPISGSISID